MPSIQLRVPIEDAGNIEQILSANTAEDYIQDLQIKQLIGYIYTQDNAFYGLEKELTDPKLSPYISHNLNIAPSTEVHNINLAACNFPELDHTNVILAEIDLSDTTRVISTDYYSNLAANSFVDSNIWATSYESLKYNSKKYFSKQEAVPFFHIARSRFEHLTTEFVSYTANEIDPDRSRFPGDLFVNDITVISSVRGTLSKEDYVAILDNSISSTHRLSHIGYLNIIFNQVKDEQITLVYNKVIIDYSTGIISHINEGFVEQLIPNRIQHEQAGLISTSAGYKTRSNRPSYARSIFGMSELFGLDYRANSANGRWSLFIKPGVAYKDIPLNNFSGLLSDEYISQHIPAIKTVVKSLLSNGYYSGSGPCLTFEYRLNQYEKMLDRYGTDIVNTTSICNIIGPNSIQVPNRPISESGTIKITQNGATIAEGDSLAISPYLGIVTLNVDLSRYINEPIMAEYAYHSREFIYSGSKSIDLNPRNGQFYVDGANEILRNFGKEDLYYSKAREIFSAEAVYDYEPSNALSGLAIARIGSGIIDISHNPGFTGSLVLLNADCNMRSKYMTKYTPYLYLTPSAIWVSGFDSTGQIVSHFIANYFAEDNLHHTCKYEYFDQTTLTYSPSKLLIGIVGISPTCRFDEEYIIDTRSIYGDEQTEFPFKKCVITLPARIKVMKDWGEISDEEINKMIQRHITAGVLYETKFASPPGLVSGRISSNYTTPITTSDTITFSVNLVNNTGKVKITWILGDDNIKEGDTISYSYPKTGSYQVVAQIATSDGDETTLFGPTVQVI